MTEGQLWKELDARLYELQTAYTVGLGVLSVERKARICREIVGELRLRGQQIQLTVDQELRAS
jgi:hypothetical protein